MKRPSMIILVTGSREWADKWAILRCLERFPAGSLVVHGAARGADYLASLVAVEVLGFDTLPFPADWGTHGKVAGHIRNGEMVSYCKKAANDGVPVEVLAFPLDNSRGTWDLVYQARQARLPVSVCSRYLTRPALPPYRDGANSAASAPNAPPPASAPA